MSSIRVSVELKGNHGQNLDMVVDVLAEPQPQVHVRASNRDLIVGKDRLGLVQQAKPRPLIRG